MIAYVCGPRLYKIDGITIEESGIGGPWASRPNGEPYIRLPAKTKVALDKYCAMSEQERDACRVGGGCQAIQYGGVK